MSYQWLEEYCKAKPGVEHILQEEWQAWLYRVGGKMFVMDGGDKDGRPIITLKLAPAHGQLAREEYECVVPGYYMNKVHWSSVYRDGNVPDDMLKAWIDEAYELVFASLAKKERARILGE